MSVIAVINRKGGCGKSTLAAQLAVWLSQAPQKVTLADLDFQQTLVPWLKRRQERLSAHDDLSWVTDFRSVYRPAVGVVHSIMDTPSGLHGFELARLLVIADLVLVPVGESAFDLGSAADCVAEMRSHPRVSAGKVRLAVVGMRVKPGTASEERVRSWARSQELDYLGSLRGSSAYARMADTGLSLFDLPADTVQLERDDWQPIGDWLTTALESLRTLSNRRPVRAYPELGMQSVWSDSTLTQSTLPHDPWAPSSLHGALAEDLPRSTRPASLTSVPGRTLHPRQVSVLRRLVGAVYAWRHSSGLRPHA